MRNYSFFDQLAMQANETLNTVFADSPKPNRPSPAENIDNEKELTVNEMQHAAGLMRVNHTGEVCAQALYAGQAFTAKDPETQTKMQQAADEETDHLAWCEQRLNELDAKPSKLNLFWYLTSFKLGAVAGFFGDKYSLGFVIETENQVEAHLAEHLQQLPENDKKSRAIVKQMQYDEAQHASMAKEAGGVELPTSIKKLMKLQAKIMKGIAYYI